MKNQKLYDLFKNEVNLKETIITQHTDSNLLKYIIEIRNLNKLDTEIITNISQMCKEDIIIILNTYNDVTDAFNKFIQDIK